MPPECSGSAPEVEPNDTFETAQGRLAPGTTLCGYLDDSFDFYYVEVSAPGRLTVTLQNVEIEPGTPPLNLLKLFTAGTAPMDWCCLTRRDRIELTVAVNFGRYYILVDAREIIGLPYVLTVGYEATGGRANQLFLFDSCLPTIPLMAAATAHTTSAHSSGPAWVIALFTLCKKVYLRLGLNS